MTQRYIALVPAAGQGVRFGSSLPKQYLPLLGRPLMWYALAALAQLPIIEQVAVVIQPDDIWFDRFDWEFAKITAYRVGGASRAQSVRAGLEQIGACENDWVIVHDAARCCITSALLMRLIDALVDDPVGGLLALPVADTIKRANAEFKASATLARNNLWLAQTPQMFRAGMLSRALAQAPLKKMTDEASALEFLGFSPRLILGEVSNFKVTLPTDLPLAEAILSQHYAREGA